MSAVNRVGHISVILHKYIGLYERSYAFWSDRIVRSLESSKDKVLLRDELRVLSQSSEIFGRALQGEVAVPLGRLFVEDELLRRDAYEVLISMGDCGAEAAVVLSEFTTDLREEIASIEDDSERLWRSIDYTTTVALLGRLGSAMGSTVLLESLQSLYELDEIRRRHPNLLEHASCG